MPGRKGYTTTRAQVSGLINKMPHFKFSDYAVKDDEFSTFLISNDQYSVLLNEIWEQYPDLKESWDKEVASRYKKWTQGVPKRAVYVKLNPDITD